MANEVLYGMENMTTIFGDTITEVGVDRVNGIVDEALAIHNEMLTTIQGFLVEDTIAAEENVLLPASGTLQPVDEEGEALPTRPAGSYSQGYPFQRGEDASGGNLEALAHMTVGDMNRKVIETTKKDLRWSHMRIVAACLTNTAYNYFDDALKRNVSVTPFANGDTVVYNKRGLFGTATDDHYLAQAGAIADGANDPFQAIFDDLFEHPSNGQGTIVCYAAPDLLASIEALSGFTKWYQTTTVQRGADQNTISPTILPFLEFGTRIIGEHDAGVVIVRMDELPAGYMMNFSTSAGNYLVRRQDVLESWRGLRPSSDFMQTPVHIYNRFSRKAGYAVRNRTSGLMYFVGNATWVNPTGLTAPLVG